MFIVKFITFFIYIEYVIGKEENILRNTLPSTNFRKIVEEVSEELSTEDLAETDSGDTQNLVSLMVKNIKEIFSQSEAPIVLMEFEDEGFNSSISIQNVTTINPIKDIVDITNDILNTKFNNDINATTVMEKSVDKIAASPPIVSKEIVQPDPNFLSEGLQMKFENKNSKRNGKDKHIRVKTNTSIDNNVFSSIDEFVTLQRSCIACNNILQENCNDPKNTLIPSKVCKRDDDLCYSRHTPFGLVERGCFNRHHDLTIYVCSCNLCNHLSMAEMPYLFPTKQDWKDNVIDLSRTKRFKKNIFKEMSCLVCEVEENMKFKDEKLNTNCLDGSIGLLPTQECAENEICGVKVIKSSGYVWRGCLSLPLYNHWWTFCDRDLCNHDSIFSVFD